MSLFPFRPSWFRLSFGSELFSDAPLLQEWKPFEDKFPFVSVGKEKQDLWKVCNS